MTAGPDPATPTTLYRFYDTNDRLLYVGISERGPERWRDHRREKPWWTELARTTVEHYATRQLALEAERAAIIAEKPLHNVVHNGGKHLGPAMGQEWTGAELAAWRVLDVGEVLAVLTESDDCPPVGRVSRVTEFGFRLHLYSWLTSFFGHKEILIRWDDVIRIEFTQSWREGECTVYDMDPLADFQDKHKRNVT